MSGYVEFDIPSLLNIIEKFEDAHRGIIAVNKVKDLKRACIISSQNNINKINVSCETLAFMQKWINE